MERFAIGAVVLCGVGIGLAWLRVVPALVGFGLFVLGGLGTVAAAVATILGLLRGRTPGLGRVLATVVALVFLASALPGVGLPRINDFSTDLDDPPVFVHAGTLPANVGRDMVYPPAFAPQQRECCADLRAAVLPMPPAEAFSRAFAVARSMPRWEITHQSPLDGTFEAVVTTPVFGFRDDVVIRVRPGPRGGSEIDVRSKSRDGRGDIGANAARIRRYVDAVEDGL